mmetsp:Transcript_63542/g.119306  ORF Transcript_63542/g.119306 Transcript_63542/m.119306 type:complete len:239 (-) Transcript_63542:1492-2208(-)
MLKRGDELVGAEPYRPLHFDQLGRVLRQVPLLLLVAPPPDEHGHAHDQRVGEAHDQTQGEVADVEALEGVGADHERGHEGEQDHVLRHHRQKVGELHAVRRQLAEVHRRSQGQSAARVGPGGAVAAQQRDDPHEDDAAVHVGDLKVPAVALVVLVEEVHRVQGLVVVAQLKRDARVGADGVQLAAHLAEERDVEERHGLVDGDEAAHHAHKALVARAVAVHARVGAQHALPVGQLLAV